MVSKLEINIRSLLAQCEELSKDETNFWRLKKYIKSLDIMIDEFKENISLEPQLGKSLSDYCSRLEILKTTTNYEAVATKIGRGEGKIRPSQQRLEDNGDNSLKEINQINDAKQQLQMKKDLFQEDELRQRGPKTENMEAAVKHYTNIQEKITEDMLSLTRNLREQTETANKIIKRDTKIVTKSAEMSEGNIGKLSKEATKLEDHSRKAWKCWLWLMIAVVLVVFIFMVLLMKIMKKRTT